MLFAKKWHCSVSWNGGASKKTVYARGTFGHGRMQRRMRHKSTAAMDSRRILQSNRCSTKKNQEQRNMAMFLPSSFKKFTYVSHGDIDVNFVATKFGMYTNVVKSELKQLFTEICISHDAVILKSDSSSFSTTLRCVLKHRLQSAFPELFHNFKHDSQKIC